MTTLQFALTSVVSAIKRATSVMGRHWKLSTSPSCVAALVTHDPQPAHDLWYATWACLGLGLELWVQLQVVAQQHVALQALGLHGVVANCADWHSGLGHGCRDAGLLAALLHHVVLAAAPRSASAAGNRLAMATQLHWAWAQCMLQCTARTEQSLEHLPDAVALSPSHNVVQLAWGGLLLLAAPRYPHVLSSAWLHSVAIDVDAIRLQPAVSWSSLCGTQV